MSYNCHLSDAQRERLALLAEEAGELVQAAMKILRHGYESVGPNKLSYDNRTALEIEIGHVGAAISFLDEADDITKAHYISAQVDKQNTIGPYLHFQK